MSEWIKCAERMPSKNTSCIVFRCDIKEPIPCNMYWDGSAWMTDGYGISSDESWEKEAISHWMPLPEPPK